MIAMDGRSFKREIARRVFAFELNKATHKIESGDRAVQVLLPTGVSCNRVFIVGVLLDREETRPDSDFWKVRISDPTGVFRGFVGRFQPDALESLLKIEPPEIVAVVAKIRLFEGDTTTVVTIRPEVIIPVEREVRDYWVIETAKHTLERINRMRKGGNELVELAWQVYEPDLDYYEEKVKEAVRTLLDQHAMVESETEARESEEPEEVSEEEEKAKAEESEVESWEGEEELEGVEDIESVEREEDWELEDIDEFEFEEEEWDLRDILGE